jgi:hypothetical protein
VSVTGLSSLGGGVVFIGLFLGDFLGKFLGDLFADQAR